MCSSSTSPQREHDVFVSFRGKDVRKTFKPCLTRWLDLEGLKYFCDDEPKDAGMKIEDKIFPAIRHARVAIVVLSENYANSKWCLNELVEILKCNKEPQKIVVIPIFYKVDPADVKNLPNKSKFGQAFERWRKEGENFQQIEIWRKALQEITMFSGFISRNFSNEVELLDKIVDSLYKEICQTWTLDFLKNAIGADRLAGEVIPLLRIGQEDVRVIGISGTKGIGKTMVAGAVCKRARDEFDRFIFLDKIREWKPSDFVGQPRKLLKHLIKMNGQWPYDDFHGNIEAIKSDLGNKKILLVLDGVTEKEQMKHFNAKNRGWLHCESRILITTSDQTLLKDLKVDDKYIVEGLNRDEAFRLFCRHAFEREEPEQGYEELSRYLAHYAGGHPLALQKWGSFLATKKSMVEWRKLSDKLEKRPDLNSTGAKFGFGRIFEEYPFKVVGPCGGDRGTKYWKYKGNTDVTEIVVGFDVEGIKFITITYKNKLLPKHVTHGTKGGEESRIELEYSREYLTHISGCAKEVSGRTILQSLTFQTNRRTHPPIGIDNDGRKFSFPYTGGKIVGFHGSCNDSHLESIGAFYKPIPHIAIGCSGRVFGPFGGAGEKSWDSKEINGIFVRYADFISEIIFEVRTKSSKPRTAYGENGEENTFKVKLENPDECITSFSGYFENACDGRTLIKSLTFRTNKRILGPIGREEGKHFSSPSEAVKVIRFFGRTVDYLESIGAEVEPHYPFESVGLFGSSNASKWDDTDHRNDVRKILVEIEPDDGKFIRSITFCYEKNGIPFSPERRGGPKGKDVDPIEIDADEYLTSMSGYYMNDGITSLTFRTNRKMIGPIGKEKGMHFSSPSTGGKIVGFYGKSGKNLEAIGAYFKPMSDPCPLKSIGPFGGSSGNRWSDRKFKGVRQIKGVREIEVKHHIDVLYIKFVYDDGSQQGHTVMHDSCIKGDIPEVSPVKLDYPREYLTSISGYAQDDGAIQSLTFYSNKSIYGPYGKEAGKYFWYPSTGSRIIAFYGTGGDGETLKSIGVYTEPIPQMYPFKTIGPIRSSDGTPWDDGVHTDVRGFRISFGDAIEAIGIAYDNNGSFVSASEHGSGYKNKGSFVLGLEPGEKSINDKYKEVLLDYPKERLSWIRVWVDEGENTGPTIVRDLHIFTTNEYQTYGPFIPIPRSERDKLKQFCIPSKEDGGRIVGFFGRVGRYLHSIGARLEPY